MDLAERFGRLADEARWEEALPLIQEIVARAPQIATSWFNYGVCLRELNRHGEAVDAFLRCWLWSDQQDAEAIRWACKLIETANPDDGLAADPDEPHALAGEMLRQRFEKNPLLASVPDHLKQ